METVRSFIALELTPEVHQELAQAQSQLKASGADVKWVNPEGIHLTLKFLGSVSMELIAKIEKTLDGLAKDHRAFQLELKNLGAFPKLEYPRVIWVGIEGNSEQSISLAQDLEKRLIKVGFLPEKRTFKPHLTLGRVRSNRKRNQLIKLLQSVTLTPKTMQAEKLTLFKSTLTPSGAIYQPLYSTSLS